MRARIFGLISICAFVFSLSILPSYAADEFVKMDFCVENIFELKAEAFIDPDYVAPDPGSLASPSVNTVIPGKALGNDFDFGALLRKRAADNSVHLVSEYRIIIQLTALTNTGNKYTITQHLLSPLTGKESQETLPQGVLVCDALFAPEKGNPDTGEVKIAQPTPISIIDPQVIYISGSYLGEDISNCINLRIWITDECDTPLTDNIRADTYTAKIIFIMAEEL